MRLPHLRVHQLGRAIGRCGDEVRAVHAHLRMRDRAGHFETQPARPTVGHAPTQIAAALPPSPPKVAATLQPPSHNGFATRGPPPPPLPSPSHLHVADLLFVQLRLLQHLARLNIPPPHLQRKKGRGQECRAVRGHGLPRQAVGWWR